MCSGGVSLPILTVVCTRKMDQIPSSSDEDTVEYCQNDGRVDIVPASWDRLAISVDPSKVFIVTNSDYDLSDVLL